MDAGVTDRLSARLQTARIGFDSQPRPHYDSKHFIGSKEQWSKPLWVWFLPSSPILISYAADDLPKSPTIIFIA